MVRDEDGDWNGTGRPWWCKMDWAIQDNVLAREYVTFPKCAVVLAQQDMMRDNSLGLDFFKRPLLTMMTNLKPISAVEQCRLKYSANHLLGMWDICRLLLPLSRPRALSFWSRARSRQQCQFAYPDCCSVLVFKTLRFQTPAKEFCCFGQTALLSTTLFILRLGV